MDMYFADIFFLLFGIYMRKINFYRRDWLFCHKSFYIQRMRKKSVRPDDENIFSPGNLCTIIFFIFQFITWYKFINKLFTTRGPNSFNFPFISFQRSFVTLIDIKVVSIAHIAWERQAFITQHQLPVKRKQ